MNSSRFRSLTAVIFLAFFSTAVAAIVAHEKTATFKVYGSCDMCIERIQDAALENKHVKSAVWNLDTQLITVVYDEDAVTLEEIHKNIAAVGHDTETTDAPNRKFRKLPECCKYKRPRK